MKIWAYVTVWNEEKMIPYYLRHYLQFCERIIVLDNESTDSTRDICAQYDNVEVRTFKTNNTFNDYEHLRVKHNCIEEARGNADYIIVSDCDEFIVCDNIKEFLQSNNPTIVFPTGFQMVSFYFPNSDKQIYETYNTGTPDPWYSKPILINPNKVQNFEWIEGCHEIDLNSKYDGDIIHPVPADVRPIGEWDGHPWGRWKMQFNYLDSFNEFPIKLLHYKYMGREYVKERYEQYAIRNSQENKDAGLAVHYENAINNGTIGTEIVELALKSIQVNC